HLDDGDAAAEAANHLCELQPDIAAADDDQVLGDEVDIHHGDVGQVADALEPVHRWNLRPGSDVQEDLLRGETLAVDVYRLVVDEAGVAAIHGRALQAGHPAFDAAAGLCDDGVRP